MSQTRARVAVTRITPRTVFDDVGRLMRAVDYQNVLSKDKDTALKINISWAKFYPACSTTPWQLEGVIRNMQNHWAQLFDLYRDGGEYPVGLGEQAPQ